MGIVDRGMIFRPALNCSEAMAVEEKDRYVNYLVERLYDATLDNRVMKFVLWNFLDKLKSNDERLAKLAEVPSQVDSLESTLKKKDTKLQSVKFVDKYRIGSKLSVKEGKTENEESDHYCSTLLSVKV